MGMEETVKAELEQVLALPSGGGGGTVAQRLVMHQVAQQTTVTVDEQKRDSEAYDSDGTLFLGLLIGSPLIAAVAYLIATTTI